MAKQTFTTGQVLTAAQMTSLQQTAMGGGSTTAKTTSYVLTAADAGTVIQMNSASATTITVNTGLFAAGDSVQIQNIGAGVCTVTAGTATVNSAGSLALSQYENGTLYFNSTSAAYFFDVYQGASAASYVGANVYNSTNQTISSNTVTIVTFNSERNDTNTYHDLTTNTGRITIPTGYGGKYQIRCQLTWASGALGNLFFTLRKNGTDFFTQPAYSLQHSYNCQEDLVAGDYLDIVMYQNTGGNLTINASGTAGAQSRQEFSVIYLGA